MNDTGKIEQNTYDLMTKLHRAFHQHKNANLTIPKETEALIELFVKSVDHLYSELEDFEFALQKSYNQNFDDIVSLASSAENKLVEAHNKYEKRNEASGEALKKKFSYLLELAKQECTTFLNKRPSLLPNGKFRLGDRADIRRGMIRGFQFDIYSQETGMSEFPTDRALDKNIEKAIKVNWPELHKANYTSLEK